MPRKPKIDKIQQIITEGRIELEYVDSRMATATVHGTEEDHTTTIFSRGGICTCRGFMYRQTCSHIKALHSIIQLQEMKNMPKLATLMLGFNKFLDGGIPLGELIIVCGEAQQGKTLLVIELGMCYLASNDDKNVLMILTEERGETGLNTILAKYSQKYGIENIKRAEWIIEGDEIFGKAGSKKEHLVKEFTIVKNKLEPDIKNETQVFITAYIPNLYDIMTLIGKPGDFTTPSSDDEKGYQRWRELPGKYATKHAQKSLLAQFIEKYNIGMIITDSITFPVKTEWVNAQSNYPARSAAYGKMLGRYMHISSFYGVTMINVGHGVPRGSMDFSTDAERAVWGGANVLHSHKHILRIKRMPKKLNGQEIENHNTKRRVFIQRWSTLEDNKPSKDGSPEYVVIQVGDNGWTCPTDQISKPEPVQKKLPVKSEAKPKKVTRKRR